MNTRFLTAVLCCLTLLDAVCGLAQAAPQTTTRYGHMEADVDNRTIGWDYSITTSEGSRSPDVMYYMHFKEGSERAWPRRIIGGVMYRQWSRLDVVKQGTWSPPPVISISFGRAWVLTSTAASPHDGLMEFFTTVVAPAMEAKVGFDPATGKRLVMGHSMGGLNTALLVLRNDPRFRIDRAVMLCPGFVPLPPHLSMDRSWDCAAALRRRNLYADEESLCDKALPAFARFFPTRQAWQMEAPQLNVDRLDPASAPQLFISCTTRDPFGIYPQVAAFVEQLQARGIAHVWRPVRGRMHCIPYNVRAVARFLADVPLDEPAAAVPSAQALNDH